MKYVDPMFSVSVVIALWSTFLLADCFVRIFTLNNTESNRSFILIWGLNQRNTRGRKNLTVNKAKLNECLVMSFTYVVSVYRISLLFRSVDRVHMSTLHLLQRCIEDLWAVFFASSGCIYAGVLVWVKKCSSEVNLTVIPHDRLVNTDLFFPRNIPLFVESTSL